MPRAKSVPKTDGSGAYVVPMPPWGAEPWAPFTSLDLSDSAVKGDLLHCARPVRAGTQMRCTSLREGSGKCCQVCNFQSRCTFPAPVRPASDAGIQAWAAWIREWSRSCKMCHHCVAQRDPPEHRVKKAKKGGQKKQDADLNELLVRSLRDFLAGTCV